MVPKNSLMFAPGIWAKARDPFRNASPLTC
jgi:hypothetical protein